MFGLAELDQFMRVTGMTDDAARSMREAYESLDEARSAQLLAMAERYMRELPKTLADYDAELNAIACETGVNERAAKYLFYAACSPTLLARYQDKGIDTAIFEDCMRDLTYKVNECARMHGHYGISTGSWHNGFFNMTRFALGRMQYEIEPFRVERYEKNGHVVSKGDPAINMHIPSSGESFDGAARLASYKKAYGFFADKFVGRIIPFVCSSWLLFPEHLRFLPKQSNILGFMGDFDIIDSRYYESGGEIWRIFYDKAGAAPKDLPRDTSLRRAYADWLEKGNPTGAGYGVFFFDGEAIL